MTNKTMLITGTARGLGLQLAEYYLKDGFDVIGCSRSDSSIEHVNYIHHQIDLTNEEELVGMFRQIERVDIVLNNAATAFMNHLLTTPLDAVQKLMAINFTAAFGVIREATKLMKAQSCGRIINFSSVAVSLNIPGEAAYISSKAAINALTKSLVKELVPYNITINAIGIPMLDTGIAQSVPTEKRDKVIKLQPISREGNVLDIVNVIDFLALDKSDMISGQVINLGGVS
jgi:3-oxoacyl-[acyl-carrier protein] reductase